MPAVIKTLRSSRFIEPGPYICLLATGLVILALIVSGFFPQTLLSRRYRQVKEREPVHLESIQLKRELIGALRIDVKAELPNNRWLTYEIQLLDRQGNLLASALKPAWRKSGIWQEEGESETWHEDDLMGGLDVRPTQSKDEVVTLALAILEYTDTSGRDLNDPVSFLVSVKNRAIDSRYLWAALFGTIALSVLSFFSISTTGKQVIDNSRADSEVGGRRTLGGSERLVKVTVKVNSDETSPRELNVCLWLKDSYGEQIFAGSCPMVPFFKKDDEGEIELVTGKVTKYFLLEKRDSYGFYAEVIPDAPVDRTQLTVREGVRTLGEVEIVYISMG